MSYLMKKLYIQIPKSPCVKALRRFFLSVLLTLCNLFTPPAVGKCPIAYSLAPFVAALVELADGGGGDG